MRFTIIFIIISSLAVVVCPGQQRDLVEDWIQKDIEALKTVPTLIEARATNADVAAKLLDVVAYRYAEDIGFGAFRYNVSRGFGYSKIEISAVIHRDKILRYRVLFGDSSSWKEIRAIIIANWQQHVRVPFEENDDSIYFELTNDDVLKGFKYEVEEELGRQNELPKLRKPDIDSYNYLTSPFENSTVGIDGCGAGGVVPFGKDLIDELAALKKPIILENVLRGLNPGGRVYALLEMTRLKQRNKISDPKVLEAMSKVSAMDLPIMFCEGGVIHRRTASQILAAVKLKK
ncbi:hypothetical protein BH24ACI3_BH24ACI3_09490 [soil metagenome]